MKKNAFFSFILLLLFTSGLGAGLSKSQTSPDLVLYYSPYCPYCLKVTRYLNSIHKTVPMKDLSSNNSYREELKRIGGKAQVPCLVINGKPLYESDAIIQWLSKNKDILESTAPSK